MPEIINNDRTIRPMTVSSLNLSRRTLPYIRLANNYLLACGFKGGDKINVEYQQNKLILTKII